MNEEEITNLRFEVCYPDEEFQCEEVKTLLTTWNLESYFSTFKVKPKNKDKDTKNIVYKIPCECGRSYYGQTSQPVQKRLKEHQKSISNHLETYSKLTEHVFSEEHQVHWAEATMIYQETNWKLRNMKEAACMAVDKTSISQPSATISPMFVPLIQEEVEEKN